MKNIDKSINTNLLRGCVSVRSIHKYITLTILGKEFPVLLLPNKGGRNLIKIKYDKKHDKLSIKMGRGFQSRHCATLYLFNMAFGKIRDNIRKSFKMNIFTDDVAYTDTETVFAYSSPKGEKDVILIPDYSFVDWREVGINNHNNTCHEIAKAGENKPVYNKIFWIGNVKTAACRETLMEKWAESDFCELIGMNWKENGAGNMNKSDRYVSLPEHTQYKYLLDVVGRGWSARLKYLLFTHRPLFIAERKFVGYYENELKSFVHYIPVKADFSDLRERYEWAESHYDEALKIAENAYNFAKENLTTEAAEEYFSKQILEYVNR